MKSEFSLIEWIRSKAPAPRSGLGIGDDAALLPFFGKGDRVVTTDAIVEDVDFLRKELSAGLAGRKALAVNLSDLAAMGAEPESFVLTLGIPKSMKTRWVQDFCLGVFSLARRYGAACVGGDLSASRNFFASITLLGRIKRRKAVLRSGARPGDSIYVTGRFGGSILGHHARFEPRLREGAFLAARIRPSSMLDVSDGLAQDLEHLLKASGCGASVDLSCIPISKEAVKLARGKPGEALQHALSDGEDFELLFSVPNSRKEELERTWKKLFPKTPLSLIGKMEKGRTIRWERDGKSARGFKIKKKGYQHF